MRPIARTRAATSGATCSRRATTTTSAACPIALGWGGAVRSQTDTLAAFYLALRETPVLPPPKNRFSGRRRGDRLGGDEAETAGDHRPGGQDEPAVRRGTGGPDERGRLPGEAADDHQVSADGEHPVVAREEGLGGGEEGVSVRSAGPDRLSGDCSSR